MLKEFEIKSRDRVSFIDITSQVKNIISELELSEGIAVIYTPHTTAGITINEGADPDVVTDVTDELNKIVPFDDNYKHFEGNSAAHIKSSMFGASETVIISNQQLRLGRWQSIYFCEFDGPRTRQVFVKVIKG